jgi:hypothetical protein
MIHHPNFSFPLCHTQDPLPHQQPQHILHQKPKPVTMSHTSHLPVRACLPFTTKRPSTLLNLLTMLWKTLNQEQLALETWTCKDPLCQVPHHQSPYHQESPMDSRSTPSIVGSRTWRPCPQPSSKDGFGVIHLPHPCMAASPLLV